MNFGSVFIFIYAFASAESMWSLDQPRLYKRQSFFTAFMNSLRGGSKTGFTKRKMGRFLTRGSPDYYF
ncbi:Oidioi.mRNA.OKI2018_I69.XSR.g14165.t1.cds [Oikopleura dioica]|uniref:Oidioi.mRNA.OKI2018_I69.XSR.g14165.t1.cds n=1 Tax=Oikopleura dioica TaxID=34765 RepID=A0ABN7S8Y9_OIKDI|nr:Oidioi.mRNA.OKI2018_I69.XSR.g14165.t1.cds [Oikopleura dioica]